jgi:hypothetical protein
MQVHASACCFLILVLVLAFPARLSSAHGIAQLGATDDQLHRLLAQQPVGKEASVRKLHDADPDAEDPEDLQAASVLALQEKPAGAFSDGLGAASANTRIAVKKDSKIVSVAPVAAVSNDDDVDPEGLRSRGWLGGGGVFAWLTVVLNVKTTMQRAHLCPLVPLTIMVMLTSCRR